MENNRRWGAYAKAVGGEWGTIVTGAILTVGLFVADRALPEDRYIPLWVWLALGFATLTVAQFRAWRKVREEADRLIAAEQTRTERLQRLSSEPVLKGETLFPYELLGVDADQQHAMQLSPKHTIENRRFEDCTFVGPALMSIHVHGHFDGCSFSGPQEGLAWERDTGWMVGPVAFVNCEFVRCRFEGIGFIGPKDLMEALKTMPRV